MVREHRVESFYSLLKAASSPLLIFPSASDADSLCALKIITHIFSSDSLRYSVHRVSSFHDLQNFAGINNSRDVISLLLINWGCHRDLRRILKLRSEIRVFVIDYHRPIHLHSLSKQNDRVIVLYTDDDERHADLIHDFDVSALADASDLNSDDADEIGDGDDSEDGGESGSKLRQLWEDPVMLYGKLKAGRFCSCP